MYTPLRRIPKIFQKLAKGQRSGPWWIGQDEIHIVHLEVGVQVFHEISFRGTLHRSFQDDLTKMFL